LFFDVEFVNYTQSNYMNITPMLIFDKFNTTQFKFDYVLDTTTEWITDEIDQTGAVKSNISIYANNGRGGDKITNMGTPPDIGPMILYTKEYNYGLGGFETGYDASNMAVKYVNASAFQIIGTDVWNYRIYFDKKVYCVPKKGRIFPTKWFIRGG
jgi:hypothetical protein